MRSILLPLLALAAILAGCVAPAPAGDAVDTGIVLGVAGHSFMNGWNADAEHIGAHPEISWPSGDEPWSFASRLNATARVNVAAGGAPSTAFVAQAEELANATLVLASFLDSSICEALPLVMSGDPDEADFSPDMRAGVQALQARGIEVILVTFPDLAALAAAARPPATQDAAFYGVLQSCAAEPGAVERARAMNAEIIRLAEELGVMSDGGALAQMEWSPDMISAQDGFHPSPAGLEAMAGAVWGAYEARDV